MRCHATSTILAALLLLAGSGCAVLEPEPLTLERRALSRARAQWLRTRPAAYRYAYVPQCDCPPTVTRAVWVTVQGDSVTSVAWVDGLGQAVTGTLGYPTIDALFERLDAAYATPVPAVRVRYDATWGYPAEALVDRDGFAASALNALVTK